MHCVYTLWISGRNLESTWLRWFVSAPASGASAGMTQRFSARNHNRLTCYSHAGRWMFSFSSPFSSGYQPQYKLVTFSRSSLNFITAWSLGPKTMWLESHEVKALATSLSQNFECNSISLRLSKSYSDWREGTQTAHLLMDESPTASFMFLFCCRYYYFGDGLTI